MKSPFRKGLSYCYLWVADFFFFLDRVFCGSGWPRIHYSAEDDLELQILLSLPL